MLPYVEYHSRPRRVNVTMPEGLQELMADMSREVLRAQPSNLNCFLADYLEALLVTRNNTWIAEKTMEDIQTMSTTIFKRLVASGYPAESEENTLQLLREFLQKFSLEVLTDSPDSNRQQIIDQLIGQFYLKLDPGDLYAYDLRSILETAFKVFTKVQMDLILSCAGTFSRKAKKLEDCSENLENITLRVVKGGDVFSEYKDNERTFLRNISDKIQKYNDKLVEKSDYKKFSQETVQKLSTSD